MNKQNHGIIDTSIFKYGTDRQVQYAEALNKHGSMTAAAKALGVNVSSVSRGIRKLQELAALHNHQPSLGMANFEVPAPYIVKGNSIRVNEKGEFAGGWIKTQLDPAQHKELVEGMVAGFSEEIPRVKPLPFGGKYDKELCNLFTLTDSHIGMLAWEAEGGENWDLEIAENVLVKCFERMVSTSPKAGTAVIAQLGDFLHTDGLLPVTPTNGHVLDASARFGDMVKASIRILRRVVDFALHTHKEVVLVVAEGNHDIASSIWLRNMFAALYENEPRVKVVDSELPYYVHKHGNVMLAFHHGHIRKPQDLPLLFATQYPKVWGDTEFRYAHCGHSHHVHEKEYSGMLVTQHSTLAPRDAYASRGGWHSQQQVRALSYHSKEGLVAMNVVTPRMVKGDD